MIEKIKNIYFNDLKKTDIELVRNWRNDSRVNRFLLNKTYITVEQQEKWFNNIDSGKEKYYLASNSNETIGLFYITNINFENKSCEPNGFIGNIDYLNTPLAGVTLIAFFDLCFNKLGFNLLEGKILVENKKFIQIHQEFGAKLTFDNKVARTLLLKKDFDHFLKKFI